MNFDIETFAAERSDALTELIAQITPGVRAALASTDVAVELLEVALSAYRGQEGPTGNEDDFLNDLAVALGLTEPDDSDEQVARIAAWLATAAMGAAAFYGADPDLVKTWVTMRDEAVRPLHRETDGVTVPMADTFDLNGTPTRYPGEPVGPIENWINCRCVLHVGADERLSFNADDVLVAAIDDGEDEPPVPDEVYERDDDMEPMQWHAILTVEGPASGDRRRFAKGALTWRELPLPLEWQEVTAPEHNGAVTVGVMSGLARAGDEIRAWGHYLANDKADEVIGMIAEGAVRSISPTVDDIVLASDPMDEYEDGRGGATMAQARISSGTIVNVGAFPEAIIKLGPPPDDWFEETPADEPLVAAGGKKGVVVVARPSNPESYAVEGGLPAEELHVTLGYYGDAESAPDGLRERLTEWLDSGDVYRTTASVGGVARMGNDDPQATVLLLESPDLAAARLALEAVAMPDMTHPHFTPHMTLGYGIDPPDNYPAEIALDGLELWWAGETLTAATFREFTEPQRREAADEGHAMPDGSYPIKNLEDLRNAIQAIGRAKDPEAVKRHIRKRARALNHPELIPDTWAVEGESFAPNGPGDKRGPGWVTNPEETRRLHHYWTRGPGAAKIGWGAPHDFYRCRRQLSKYIGPKFLNRTCAEWHHDALGYWPGQHAAETTNLASEGCPCDNLALVASSASSTPVSARLFDNPNLTEPTAPTLDPKTGHFYGHLATWGTCHLSFAGKCVEPPRSKTNYAYYHTGVVDTDEGEIPVGVITMDTLHASHDLSAADTIRHYEDTGAIAASVRCGEDEHGIWFSGKANLMGEGDFARFRAAALSGDWRRIGGNLELVSTLAVNTPGFPVPRPSLAASAGVVTSLVAANPVVPVVDGLPEDLVDLGRSIVAALARRNERRQRLATLQRKVVQDRAAALVAAVEGV